MVNTFKLQKDRNPTKVKSGRMSESRKDTTQRD